MITSVALEGGSLSGFTDYSSIWGINQTVFNKVKADIKKFNDKKASIFSKLGVADTKANRKYFLYGCAMHSMTDAFDDRCICSFDNDKRRVLDRSF